MAVWYGMVWVGMVAHHWPSEAVTDSSVVIVHLRDPAVLVLMSFAGRCRLTRGSPIMIIMGPTILGSNFSRDTYNSF